MPTRSATMDRGGTFGPATAASVDLTLAAPCWVPDNGFEWVQGVRSSPNSMVQGLFLVRRPGPNKVVEIPKDLHLEFAELAPNPDSILSFAERHGSLWRCGKHFHPGSEKRSEEGEDLDDWQLEVRRVKAVRDLWHGAESPKGLPITRKLLEQIPKRKAGEPWVLVTPESMTKNKPRELAKEIVIATINAALTPGFEGDPPCLYCKALRTSARQYHDYTRACLRPSEFRSPELVVVPTNLIKALWLQVAAMVAGQRTVKKCQAPDCGRYMDVTTSPHPGACRMHPWCAERLRKRRWRKGLRRASRVERSDKHEK